MAELDLQWLSWDLQWLCMPSAWPCLNGEGQ